VIYRSQAVLVRLGADLGNGDVMAGLLRCAITLSAVIIGSSGGGMAMASSYGQWVDEVATCRDYLPDEAPRDIILVRTAEFDARFDAEYAGVRSPVSCPETPHAVFVEAYRPRYVEADRPQPEEVDRPPHVKLSPKPPSETRHPGMHEKRRAHHAGRERVPAVRKHARDMTGTNVKPAVKRPVEHREPRGDAGRRGIAARPPVAGARNPGLRHGEMTQAAERKPMERQRGASTDLPLATLGVFGLLALLIVQMWLYQRRSTEF